MTDDAVRTYVQQALTSRLSKEQIYLNLLQKGYTVASIEAAFVVHNTAAPVATPQSQEESHDKVVKLVILIGVVLVGAGIFSFIAANWQEMTRMIKLTIIVVAMLVSYGSGWYFEAKQRLSKISTGLILLGSIIYGAGIFLIAQMFNIRANWPDGFIIWMIGSLALAFALESFPLYGLAIITAIVAIIGHPFIIFESIGSDRFLMTSALLLFIATATCLTAGLLLKRKLPPAIKELY